MEIDVINKVVDEDLIRHYSIHDGFIFSEVTQPANVYDAILIKNPNNAPCSSPRRPDSQRSLQEHIDLINEYHLEKAIIIAENIDFITECPSLKYIRIKPADNAGNNFDYSPLYRMPQIKSLSCATLYGDKNEFSTSIDYSEIKGLESVSISGPGHINYNGLSSLKTLGISGYKGVDLTNMFCGCALDTLGIIQCGVKSLEGIEKAKNMKCLYLDYNRFLQDISALSTAKKTLTALSINHCSKIKDFSNISELENLEFLQLTGSNSAPSLDFIKPLKKLKTFVFDINILDGDLSPCTRLSYVRSLNNRSHYNLKDNKLPKGNVIYGNESIELWRRYKRL